MQEELMPERPAPTGHFILDLDGVKCGFLKSIDGGAVTADVIGEPAAAIPFVKKHIGRPRYEEAVIELGLGMDKTVYDWIAASWQGKAGRKNGTVFATDFNNEARRAQEFMNALITEVTIPACDASSRDPAYLALTFAPESTRTKKAGGKIDVQNPNAQKMWLPSNFRLEIGGLDGSRVMKVDAFTVKQSVPRDPHAEPARVEFPNLRITLPISATSTWETWFEDFVVKGNSSDANEKNGTLSVLAPNLSDVLATIRFFNLGIFRLAPERLRLSGEQLERWVAELYCERMEFQV
jgi:T4-like virus tail tube protein gp19